VFLVVGFLAVGIDQVIGADEAHLQGGRQGAEQIAERVGDGLGAICHQRREALLALFAIDTLATEAGARVDEGGKK
jgi:hypothetical protein